MGTLYENISRLCKQRGIKGGKMCVDIGMSKGILTDLKMGRQTGISTSNAKKIADYFGVSVDQLLDVREDPNCTPDTENPYELELRDTFGTLDIDDQIYVKNWVNGFAKDPAKVKNSPTELQLSEGEQMLIDLFRQVPEEQQQIVLQMIRAALGK